jgi:phytol kinase
MLEFVRRLWEFPSLNEWMIFLPLGLILGGLFGWLTGYLKDRFSLKTGYSRKMFHFIIFTLAAIMGLTTGFQAVQVFGVAIGIVVVRAVLQGEKNPLFRAIARPTDKPYEKYYIVIPFLMTAAGGMLSNILFGKWAVIGYAVTGWGDAVGEPAGTRWGKHKYKVPTLKRIDCYRSLEGSLAVFIASLTGSFIVLSFGFHLPVNMSFLAAVSVAMISTLVEAITFHSLDNLTLQVAATATAVYTLNLLGFS